MGLEGEDPDNVFDIFDPAFRVTSSLLWSPGINLHEDKLDSLSLKHHQTRLTSSAQAFNLELALARLSGDQGLTTLESSITAYIATLTPSPTSPLKLTVSVSATGAITIASTRATPPLYPFILPQNPPQATNLTATVHLSPTSTPPTLFMRHKTNLRAAYNAVRAQLSISELPPTTTEVLLHNPAGKVTEASLSTVYFWRDERWVTPSAECGGNLGVTRALALDRGWCVEGTVDLEEIKRQEVVGLSNGVRGFWFAVVV
jgi:4-amino-4-deoxychorismate lyase